MRAVEHAMPCNAGLRTSILSLCAYSVGQIMSDARPNPVSIWWEMHSTFRVRKCEVTWQRHESLLGVCGGGRGVKVAGGG